jgi:hypothetical protein
MSAHTTRGSSLRGAAGWRLCNRPRMEPPDDPDGFPLGNWVLNRRKDFKQGKASDAWIAKLNAIEGWSWSPFDEDWQRGLKVLKAYLAREGHLRVPFGYCEGEFALDNWIKAQRRKRKRGVLSSERSAELEALPGWTWDVLEEQWEEGFRHLLRFVEREGTARVPQSDVERGFRLGSWVATQRLSYRQGRLAAERAGRLQSLPGWVWDARENASGEVTP